MDAPTITVAREYKTREEKQLTELLTECARDGHFLTVKALIEEAKADINAHNLLGLTAFQLAYWNRHFQISNLLIQKGAINARTDFLLDELVLKAPSFKLDSTLEQRRKLIEQYKYDDALIEFVQKGCFAVVKGLIEEVGANINAVNCFGLTPLKQAVKEGQTKIVEYFIQKGVDVNASHAFGSTALTLACSLPNRKEITYLLLKAITPEERTIFAMNSDFCSNLVKIFDAEMQKISQVQTPLIFSQEGNFRSVDQIKPEPAAQSCSSARPKYLNS